MSNSSMDFYATNAVSENLKNPHKVTKIAEIVKLTKSFGKEFMPTVFLNTENVNESLGLHERPTQKSGVVLNMKCPKSDQILGIVSQ